MRHFSLLILMASTLLSSCGKEQLAPRQYVNWVRDEANGLQVAKQLGDHRFTLLYKPYEYIALMQDKNEQINSSQMNAKIAPLKGLQYYTLTITTANGEELMRENNNAESDYYNKLDYLVSYMQNDISLIDGKDTLSCALYHFERNYNIGPDNNILLGFEIPENDDSSVSDKTLVVNDQLFGAGKVMITISGQAISKIPQLQLLSQ